jgi:LmbE family N-acetylglucosaminyl deacetylase
MNHLRSLALGAVLLLCFGQPQISFAARNPKYFPETGKEAIHQRALDAGNAAVVLTVSLQPGYEDFPLLTQLRLGAGARAVSVYFTNGDATPDDNGCSSPVFTAAQRKDEAYAATRLLDVIAYFLNIPDPGVIGPRTELKRVWNVDTATSRLEKAIRHFRPDIVVIGGDFRGDTLQSTRQTLMTEIVLNAAGSAASPPKRSDSANTSVWNVPRIYIESSRDRNSRQPAYDVIHSAWKQSYRSIAAEVGLEYRTLHLQRPFTRSVNQEADRERGSETPLARTPRCRPCDR